MLPDQVTTAILQLVPQRQRLGQCALVCRSWLAAAVAATTSVRAVLRLSAHPTTPAHMESLSRWLQHHGSGVSDLSIVYIEYRPERPLKLDIPFSNLQQLQELHLSELNIDASNSGNSSSSSLHSGRWADLTALTSLHLNNVTLHDIGDGSALNSITSLRQLVLSSIDCPSKGLPSLAPLTRLTCLVLKSTDIKGEAQGIGQLIHLKRLELATIHYESRVLDSLPFSLTHLDLYQPMLGTDRWDITTSTASRLGKLTALVHLEVRGRARASFDPQLLSNLVQLRHLNLGECQLKHDMDPVQGVNSLLAVLPGLCSLQHLDLVKCMVCPITPVQQYSALGSSALTYLDLRGCWLQDNAVLHMFQGQHCPALQHLRLGADDDDLRIDFADLLGTGLGIVYSARRNALDALTTACPALQELQLLDVVHPDCWAQLSALEYLTALSKLALQGDVIHDDSINLLTSLALPALRDLELDSMDPDESVFTVSWVLHLREFTQLTRLEIQLNANLLRRCAHDQRLFFGNKNGLTHLPELFDAALPESVRAKKLEERDYMLTFAGLMQEFHSKLPIYP